MMTSTRNELVWSSGISNLDLENKYYQAEGISEFEGSDEVVADGLSDGIGADLLDLDMESTLKAVIMELLQDVEKDFESKFCRNGLQESDNKIVDSEIFEGINWGWNDVMTLPEENGGLKVDEIYMPYSSWIEILNDDGLLTSNQNISNWVGCDRAKELQDCGKVSFDDDGTEPHDALFFSLHCLGMEDLLSVESVCRSARDAVRGDSLLWKSIDVDHPLSQRITDDALVKLTNQAHGTLQSLTLVDALLITDNGLKRVLESNPRLTKLDVAGCVRLSIEGILSNLRAFNSTGNPGIRHLRIGGMYGITDNQFEELKFLIGADNSIKVKAQKPLFYHGKQSYISSDDDRAIDIEMCPKCDKLRLVYDCPAESCQGKQHASEICRACTLCIARCFHCGRCLKNRAYEETFSLDFVCLDCCDYQSLKFQEKPETKSASSSSCTILNQETSYQLCLNS